MRTTTTLAVLASMFAIGCAPIGTPGERDRVDAGAGSAATCDDMTTTSMDIDFTSSAALDALPTGCWSLDGKLTIDSSVTSLAKLGDLRSVNSLVMTGTQLTKIDTPNPLAIAQSLDIENDTKLTDLSNLSVPTDSTGGTCGTFLSTVTLKGNSALTALGALNQLRCVTGTADFENNTELADLDLSNAIRLEGGLTVTGNTALKTIELGALSSVTSALPLGDAISITNNTALTNLGTWSALQYVHGSVTISSNAALTSLGTWTTLATIDGSLTISSNAALTSLGTWTALAEVGGGVTIDSNAALTSLASVLTDTQAADISFGGALAVTNNAALTDLGSLDHLAYAESINIAGDNVTYCNARSVGCCVRDGNPTNAAAAAIETTGGTNCAQSSWCFASDGNACHSNYTDYQYSQYGIK